MKKILASLVLVLVIKVTAWAQPTFNFSSANPCTGETACIDITVKDFTDIASLKFPIRWNPKVVQLTEIKAFNLPGLDLADFDRTKVDSGLVFLNWVGDLCEKPNPNDVTIPDGTRIFQLCFKALGGYASTSTVEITDDPKIIDDPEPILVKRPPACFNIGLLQNPGFVSTCVRPLKLIASNTTGNKGDLVCTDVKVTGFDGLTSLQFTMNWDSTILDFASVINTEKLVNLGRESFGTPERPNIGKGKLTLSWSWTDTQRPSITVPDSTSIFQVCFNIIGDCETSSKVEFTSKLTPLEAINVVQDTQYSIPILSVPGEVKVGTCAPSGLQLFADCGQPVKINDEVCVKVSPRGMSGISQFTFLMEWNPNILRLKGDPKVLVTNISNFSASNFNKTNAGNGILGVDWKSISGALNANVPDNTPIFEVCFEVIGLGGDSPFRFNSSTAVVRKGTNTNIGIAPNNCAVQVIQPEGVQVLITGGQAVPGDSVCLDFQVKNFKEIVKMDFSLAWEPSHLQFLQTKNFNLAGASAANFNLDGVDGGLLSFQWQNNTPQTLADGASLFQLCYKVVGTPPGELGQEKNCNAIQIIDIPIVRQVVSATSNGNDIGLTPLGGDVCVLNPEGFFLVIGKEQGFKNDTVCVGFKAVDFDSITSAKFTVNWDPTGLKYASVKGGGPLNLVEGTNLITTSANVGILNFNWTNNAGQSVPDSTEIFKVCFVPVGTPQNCYPITVDNEPTPSVTTLTGAGSVFPIDGEVCIQDRLIITDTIITPVTCGDSRDGTIQLKVEGGKGTIFFLWESIPRQFSSKAVNLPEGKIAVTVFDESRPTLILRDTFEIPMEKNLPVANAGPDKTLGCDPPFTLLSGSGSTGTDFAYSWSTVAGSLPGDTERPSVIAGAPGFYFLRVTNKKTGCGVVDTVFIKPPTLPVANAGRDQFFSCKSDTLVLDGAGSTQGDSIAYRWTALDGGIIAPGDETKQSPEVNAPGIYALQVRNIINGCVGRDTVLVENATELPDADAGPDQELGCTGTPATLDASGSFNPRPVILEWLDGTGKVIGTSRQVQVNQLGDYFLRITEEGSGCIAIDTVKVIPTPAYPDIKAGNDVVITCSDKEPKLSASIANTTNFTLRWIAQNGGQLKPGTDTTKTPSVTTPGRFILEVKDITSSCISRDTVDATQNIVVPTVDAGVSDTLTCVVDSVLLRGTASSANQGLRFTWTSEGKEVGKDTLGILAREPGVYLLRVDDPTNGCFAIDSVFVPLNADIPQVTAPTPPVISCKQSEVRLNAVVDPANASYTVTWSTSNGRIVSGGNSLTPVAGAAGNYQILVKDNKTGCEGTATVAVIADTIKPIANAGPDQTLTCKADSVILNGSGSASGARIAYKWTASAGGTAPQPGTTPQVTIRKAGSYALEVRDTLTGCFAIDSVKVLQDTIRPQVAIATPQSISCATTRISLDGSGSSQGSNIAPEWTGLSGQTVTVTGNPFIVQITRAGGYQLKVRNTSNGCENAATIQVTADTLVPVALVESPVTLPCPGAVRQLNAGGTSTGADFAYLWSTVSGSGTITNGTSLTPQINSAGTYALVVTNSKNGCKDTAQASVVIDPNLEKAAAGLDQATCDDNAQVTGNLPAGTTGQWRSTSGASVETPSEFVTEVFALKGGANTFIWTLSKAECPNYSADTVVINREITPNANNDLLTIESGKLSGSINLVQNDQINTRDGFTLTIQRQPTLGKIDSLVNGLLNYSVAPRLFGQDEFTYSICSRSCPNLCDTALVKVDVKFDPNAPKAPVVNAITPNGDGANDELRFELLDNADPARFPDNEIIIFNRWGDIVYRAKPYLNDWRGTNSGGQELPHGTYYYILRLDIANGLIIQGDITILK